MPLKEKFLSYVEMQRSANAAKEAFGFGDPRTRTAYEKANEMKKKVMNDIEELEYRMASLEK